MAEEKNEIVGKLIAQGEAWDLLELYPRAISFDRGVRRVLRETTLEFLVLYQGEPRYILVAGGFVIIPKVEPEEDDKLEEIGKLVYEFEASELGQLTVSDELVAKEN